MLGTWIALNSATVPRMRGMVGLLPVLLLFLVVPHEVALAECSDKPKPGVDWSKCQKMRLVLRGQDLSEAQFERANLGSTDLMDATLVGAMMVNANLERARLKKANLQSADLTKVQGARANFEEANTLFIYSVLAGNSMAVLCLFSRVYMGMIGRKIMASS